MKNITKTILIILAFLPLAIEFIFTSWGFRTFGSINWLMHVTIAVLLASIGVGLISTKKFMQWLGIGALATLTILLGIIGYYDYLQWFSTIVGIVLLAYFSVIGIAIKKMNRG